VPAPILTEITVAAEAATWADAGFWVAAEACVAGDVRIGFAAGAGGILDWALTEVDGHEIDGLATRAGEQQAAADVTHPNGVVEIDHLVVLTPSLERTIAAFEAIGVELRRIREGETGMGPYRQAFFRLGRPVLEVVEAADMEPETPARFWGITFSVADIDAAAELLGERIGRVKDAVQPGRRIATVRREAGLGVAVALISAKGQAASAS
jgi:hypothetical protein